MHPYTTIISRFHNKKILVIGDLILDRYILGSVSRISPEAPVPIDLEEKSYYTPGGAANVGHNLSALGAHVLQVGKIGDDTEGRLLRRKLKEKKIDTSGIFTDKKIPTITKTRIMAQHQQVVRIDREKVGTTGSQEVNGHILNFIKRHLKDFDAVIISDYGKGLITPELLSLTCALALEHKKIITVDPKVENFKFYTRVTAITPNKKEAENAIRDIKIKDISGGKLKINTDHLETLEDIDRAGGELLRYLQLESLLITLGEQGMRLFEKGKKPVSIETKAREVYDVTGAGDTVISVFTLSLTAGAAKPQAADLANHAAGIVIGKMGAVAVSKKELLQTLKG